MNRSHPLAEAAAVVFVNGVNYTGLPAVAGSGGGSPSVTPLGAGKASTTAGGEFWSIDVPHVTGSLTAAWFGTKTNVNYNCYWSQGSGDGVGGAFNMWSDANGAFNCWRTSGTATHTGGNASINGKTSIIWTHDVDTDVSVVYLDGQHFSTLTGKTDVGGGSGNPIRIGRRADGVTQLNGTCTMAGVWRRALSANEVSMLFADPFCMLKG